MPEDHPWIGRKREEKKFRFHRSRDSHPYQQAGREAEPEGTTQDPRPLPKVRSPQGAESSWAEEAETTSHQPIPNLCLLKTNPDGFSAKFKPQTPPS